MRVTCVMPGTGQVGQISKVTGKGKKRVVTILDSSNLEAVTANGSDVMPVGGHQEFLRDTRTDEWVQLTARRSEGGEVRKILKTNKDRTPRCRENPNRNPTCEPHANHMRLNPKT